MIYIQDVNGNWGEGQPVRGQLYRIIKDGNTLVESYWADSPE